MEKKLVQKFVKLFAFFYAGLNLMGLGLESRFSSSLFNYSSIFFGLSLILLVMAYCVTKCVITYMMLTSKQG